MGQAQIYKYDVFISYRDHPDHTKWVRNIFLPHFTWHLSNSKLGRSARVYFDKDVNQPGDKWERVIKDSLACSAILVPFWSIPYFESKWCRMESAIMLHREERLGYLNQERPGSLIVPVRFADGETYPELVRGIQQFECWDYTGARKGSSREARLGREIKSWVESVAERIKGAPPWDPEWLGREWLEKPAEKYEKSKLLWPPGALDQPPDMG